METNAGKNQDRVTRDAGEAARNTQPQPATKPKPKPLPKAKKGGR